MSNRRRLPPPPAIRAYAKSYKCGHCASVTSRPRRDPDTRLWRIDVRHDESCPVLAGHVSRRGAGITAAIATASAGRRVLYVETG